MIFDPQIIAFLAIMTGAVFGIVVPWYLKLKEEGGKFELSYLYSMILSLVVAAFVVLPEKPELSFKGLFTLFLAGAGLEWMANKANTIRKKRKVVVE